MFRLDPKPSFWLTVLIPEAGGEGQRMRAEFCYMTLEEYKAHFMVMARKPVAEFLTPGSIGERGLLIGWATTDAEDGSYLGMPEAFSAEAVARLVNAFPRAGQALVDAYRAEMFTGVSPALGN